jgi:hypothetical protein
LTCRGTVTGRRYLPKWAMANAAVLERCADDVPFRFRVMNADRDEREALVVEAETWAARRVVG